MADESCFVVLRQGVDAWNRWREANPGTQPDLSEARLSTAVMSRDLAGINLSGAVLTEAKLIGMNLQGANLGAARLDQVDLRGTNLFQADLRGASLDRANLSLVSLREANLSGANLYHADLTGSDLLNADLSGALMLKCRWTEAGQVRVLVKAVPEAALQKLRRLVPSDSRLNAQFFTNGGVTPKSATQSHIQISVRRTYLNGNLGLMFNPGLNNSPVLDSGNKLKQIGPCLPRSQSANSSMAQNPFEQLQYFVPEPRQAFEDLVAMLLQDCRKIDGRTKVHCGDGGVDGYKGNFAKDADLVIYQIKYFPNPLENSQKQQIRSSFKVASESERLRLKEWILCIPTRPTRKDLSWFHEWSGQQTVPIDMFDGDDLTQLLESPDGGRTRERFRDWGVFSVRSGSPVLQARIECVARDPRTRQTFRLNLFLKNRGDRTAEDIKVRLEHSPTKCTAVPPDQSLWDNIVVGSVNPRELRARSDLHPGEDISVIEIPLSPVTPFPLSISVRYWLRDQGAGNQSLVMQAEDLANNKTYELKPGQLAITSQADGGFLRSDLKWPQDGALEGLLTEIAQHSRPEEFGILYYGPDAADQSKAVYLPHLSQRGMFHRANQTAFAIRLKGLLDLGWLDPPERIGNIDRYRLSDAGRSNDLFLYQVEQFEKRREQGGYT